MRSRAYRSSVVVLLAAAVLAGVPRQPAAAQRLPLDERSRRVAVKALATGKLLVAARQLPDPNFARSVILLSAFTREGAVGFIVNRPTQVTLREMFPHLTPTLASSHPAFFGGPVQTTGVAALVRAASPAETAKPIGGGLFLVSSREGLEALIASAPSATAFRVYVGYAGWGPGQLEAETLRGAWHVLEGDADVVFDRDPATTWQRQIARTEGLQAQVVGPEPRDRRASTRSARRS